MAGVCDQQDIYDLDLALSRHLWKIRVNKMLSSIQKPTIQDIQRHLKEVCICSLDIKFALTF